MAVKYNSWTDWFNVNDSADVINKTNQEVLFKALSAQCSDEAYKSAV